MRMHRTHPRYLSIVISAKAEIHQPSSHNLAIPPYGSSAFAEDDDARSQQVGVGGGAAPTDGWGRAVGKSVGILGR
jgi:hypothetical protein